MIGRIYKARKFNLNELFPGNGYLLIIKKEEGTYPQAVFNEFFVEGYPQPYGVSVGVIVHKQNVIINPNDLEALYFEHEGKEYGVFPNNDITLATQAEINTLTVDEINLANEELGEAVQANAEDPEDVDPEDPVNPDGGAGGRRKTRKSRKTRKTRKSKLTKKSKKSRRGRK